MSSIAYLSALELASKIRDKQISSVEITQHYIDRIEKYDDSINAVVVRTFEDALEKAAAADAALGAAKRGSGQSLGRLHGVPMTIKESYVMANTPTTWGIEGFRHNVAKSDGLTVQRFRGNGAHFLGKTNVPVELADFQSYNPIYGTTGNPFDTTKTPGGSSGGSAAALAAGFTGLEAGSDIGGSIRNPAHYCGVYGHKPTYGIVPMQGHELVANMPEADLAVCGPLARTAEDLELALNIMAGPADQQAVGWRLSLPASDKKNLRDFRVAIWPTDEMAPVTAEIADRATMVGETLSKLGATVSDLARPDIDLYRAQGNYHTLLNTVMSGAMDDDAVAAAQRNADQFDSSDNSMAAITARSLVLSHRDWMKSNAQREQLRHAWRTFFEEWDILICPQMATTAFPHDHRQMSDRTLKVDNEEQDYLQQIFWAGMAVNAYLPSTVFPTGLSREGLPIGLQAISAPYRDYRTIEFTRLISREIGGFIRPEELDGTT